MKPYWMILLVIPLMGFTFLDPVAKKNQEGNELFQQGEYDEALKRYREAQVEAQNRPELHFNTGTTLYKKEDYQNALQEYGRLLEAESPELAAQTFYNLGNAYYRQQQFAEAVGAYKKSLELNSDDLDSKINLELALEKLKEQQDQQNQEDQQDQQDQGQQNQDDQQDQQDPDQNQQDQDQQNQQDQQDQQNQQGQEGQQPPPQPGQLSQEEAERILDAMKDRETEAQKRRRVRLLGKRYLGNEW